jgi:hypothetical protein
VRAPEWLILLGATAFILVLAVSAAFDPSIRWLHFFQAWMYLATIALAMRGNRWGYFIGISAAGLWDLLNIVATTFFRNGLHALSQSFRTGTLVNPDQLIAVPAWFSNALVVIGCLWAYLCARPKALADIVRFVTACALATGYFVLAVLMFQPRYLQLLTRLLHPNQWVIYRH